jgi:hypothetical protein
MAIRGFSEQRWRPRPDVLALGAPALVIGAYFSYLFHRTGSWTAWQDAEAMGWHRQNAWLWRGIALSWDSLRAAPAPDVVVSRTADLLTVLAGLVLVVVLLVLRRRPDATHLGLNVGVVAFSTLYVSAPRRPASPSTCSSQISHSGPAGGGCRPC